MEGQPTRIPLPCRRRHPNPSAEGKHVSSTSEPGSSAVPCLNFASDVPADSILNSAQQGLPKSTKGVEPVSRKTVARRPLTRYQLEAELENKNQLVKALKQQLARKEDTIKKLKEENERLARQTRETRRTILESRNINPESNIEEEKETRASWEKMHTRKTLEELKLICHTFAKEKEMLETVVARWKSAQEENQLAPKSCFQAQIKEWTDRLKELKKLLAM